MNTYYPASATPSGAAMLFTSPFSTRRTDQEFIRRIQFYVLDKLSETIDINQMASDFFISRVHLYRRIKSITGRSPSTFISCLRLQVASEMIRVSDLSLREVAIQTGFQDPRYFSRTFFQIYRCSPSDFRKQSRSSLKGN